MTNGVAFQTRARTIDHLGRGQIADAPTAISELWKNAYDAYARNVSLHVFDGQPNIAAIFDDGVGMDYDDVVRRWLVIGTESKIEEFDESSPETLGLPLRPRQGEKGIGRLSVAFLAPCTILVSKKATSDFIVVAVDWRLFENPFIALDDIRLPVEQFSSPEAVTVGLASLLETLSSNLGGPGSERGERLTAGWQRFSEYERRHGATVTTSETIRDSWQSMALTRRHLEEWPVFLGLAEHGTAMFMIDLNHELGVWVRPQESGDEVEEVKDRLRQTLTGFTDPYSESRPDFDYEVYIHRGENNARIIGASDVFGIDGLRDLEHYIDGEFDERGTFSGRIVAYGQDLGIKTFVPKFPPPMRGRDKLGPFKFAIGTFEVDERRSTHSETQHALIEAQAKHYAGVSLYRDYLRVMPYGRPDADFLGMEERRSKNAGREFWAHRRSFGRIGVTRVGNPALRDKAGREGLVDNRAFREMRLLVVEFLKDAARKYFGSDSALRHEVLPGIMERKALQKEAADRARTRRRKGMRQFLREQSAPLDEAIKRADSLVALAKDTLVSKDRVQATVLAARFRDVRTISENLRPPIPLARLGDLEEQWRLYRDDYQALLDRIQELAQLTAEVDSTLGGEAPHEVLARRLREQGGSITVQLDEHAAAIDERMNHLRQIWRNHQATDQGELERRVGHVLNGTVTNTNLLSLLNLIDVNRTELGEIFAGKYRSFIATLDQLIDGIDIEGAYAITEDDRAELEDQLRDIRAVAQIGITVEIIGHEFETLESEVRRNLNKLPAACRNTNAYEAALRAHLGLADRLRFLSPLKIGGYRTRERISGEKIALYLEEFFSRVFTEQRIEFSVTKSFRGIEITDIPSRIFPVFINLINNAVYWSSLSLERQIKIDFKDGLVIVGDSGPGVDPEDVARLFDIFFSRRRSGRGVGLYLSRANLAVAGHKIRYAERNDPAVLDGANFIIEFKGVVANG
ncbi:ATP-binding protein [Ancylobacter sp. SL191]|uniref:ATP-binding protein n=1 Tax=Ancylobacter sp. SL191 TaxID=2995166 RepID=UPI0022720EE4|nr:ATP-binding protein [Ancylobacter sp. SL191]WAC28787.1 ATP-binding protein [Ancylobacter sp. SL191]